MNPETALTLCIRIASVGVALISLERIAMRSMYRDDGPLGWGVLRRRRAGLRGCWDPVANRLFRAPYVIWASASGLASSLVLMGTDPTATALWSLSAVVIFATLALSNVRSRNLGRDGSSNMLVVIFGGLLVQRMDPDSEVLTRACLWFVAIQACLAYFFSGVGKLSTVEWRRGTGAADLLFNWPYAPAWATRRLEDRPNLVKCLTYGTLFMECAFPLVLILGHPWYWIFLAWGCAFHLSNLLVLRLNHFPWAYGATYPAIAFCASAID